MNDDEANELLSLLVQVADDHAVLLLDPEGTVTWVNPGAERILGPGDLVGEPLERIFPPSDVARGDAVHERELARREGASEDDRWQQRLDGSRFWATGQLYALRAEDGTLRGFGKILRNRTDLREQLEAYTNRIAALQAADARKDLYLATLAHELRSPLTPLRSAAELLRLVAAEEPKVRAPAALVERQVALLARLVDDLLDTTRIATGKLTLELASLVLQGVLDQAAEIVRPLTVDRRNTLALVLLPSPVWVRADATRLLQVFVNLLTNAAKFTPAGGEIWVKCSIEGSEAVVRVEDSGVGIAPEMLGEIFSVFTQVAAPTADGGIGLGLSLVKELVTLHGGTVQATSDGLGKGSQFTVRLPLAPSESPRGTVETEGG